MIGGRVLRVEINRGRPAIVRRQFNRVASRFPGAASSYRSGRRRLRLLPLQARRLLRPALIRVRRLPLPLRLLQLVWWLRTRERNVTVAIDRLLLGGENGLSGADYAELTGQPLRPSTLVERSPYVSLLQRAQLEGGLGRWFSASDYLANARRCVEVSGHYFGAVDDKGIRQRAESFVATESGGSSGTPNRTPPAQAIRVRAIRRSDYFEIVDGHHRVAHAWFRGERQVVVDIERGGSWTPLQQLLNGMSWLDGSAELYQPVPVPEVSTWSVVRMCTDRLDKMLKFLADEAIESPDGRRYLDVGSCYGWFVHEMGEHGWDARGIELDPTARRLGELVYGLDPTRITVGDCADALTDDHRADVVSCLSVLHHFALGKGSCSAEELLLQLDSATGTVLFLEIGQGHEEWFAETLTQWDEDFIERWILDNSSFRRIVRLGIDDDSVPPYEAHYGRMLFGCMR